MSDRHIMIGNSVSGEEEGEREKKGIKGKEKLSFLSMCAACWVCLPLLTGLKKMKNIPFVMNLPLSILSRSFRKRLPSFVKIVEVGPRDGLQAEPVIIPTSVKVNFINLLSKSGLKVIEATSFVHPKMVPQMGDNSTVFNEIVKEPGVNYPVLVPNLVGLNNAIKVGAKEIAVFAAATDSFSM